MDQPPTKPTQIRVGAGLEESRLNQEFLDFLRKWSTPILLVLALAAVGFVAWQKYVEKKHDKLDAAFRELEEASSTAAPSPDSLAAIARQYADVAAVPAIANSRAGDSLLFSLQTGLKAGAELNTDGTPKVATDVLTDADRTTILAQAQERFQAAFDASKDKAAQRPITLGALFGLAAVEESRGNMDQAKRYYEQIVSLADSDAPILKDDGTPGEKPFAMQGAIAKKRIGELDQLKTPIALVSESQLPKLPALPEPPAPAAGSAPFGNLPPGVTVTPVDAPPFAQPPVGPATPGTPPATEPATPPATAPSNPPSTPAPAPAPAEPAKEPK